MVRREFITPSEYEQLNNILAKSLDNDDGSADHEDEYHDKGIAEEDAGGEEEEEEGDEVKRLIRSTTKYLTSEDFKELHNLLHNIEKEAGPDLIDSVTEWKTLIDKFLRNKFDSDGELILPRIINLLQTLKSSPIALSKQERIKMLLRDIDQNRFRVESILTRLNEAEDEEDISNTLEQLKREELISPEQFEKMTENDAAFELPTIVTIIKDTKIGRGFKFLPNKLRDLTSKLESLIEEGTIPITDLLAYLDEILRQKGITSKEYQSLQKNIDDVKN